MRPSDETIASAADTLRRFAEGRTLHEQLGEPEYRRQLGALADMLDPPIVRGCKVHVPLLDKTGEVIHFANERAWVVGEGIDQIVAFTNMERVE